MAHPPCAGGAPRKSRRRSPWPSAPAATSSSRNATFTPTLKLGDMTMAMSRAAAAISCFCASLKPVVPITILDALLAAGGKVRPSRLPGSVKSISTSQAAIALAASSPIFTPQGERRPARRRPCRRRRCPSRSSAAASLRSRACSTASSSVRPMRPGRARDCDLEHVMSGHARAAFISAPPARRLRRRLRRLVPAPFAAGLPPPRPAGTTSPSMRTSLSSAENDHDPALLGQLRRLSRSGRRSPSGRCGRCPRRSGVPSTNRTWLARHPGLELGDHFLRDDVALLDVDLVRREHRRQRGACPGRPRRSRARNGDGDMAR